MILLFIVLIVNLDGLETNVGLSSLGLAGNLIKDFSELKKLVLLPKLKELSISDIHFGRCPIANESGLREFVCCYLNQVSVFDGVTITDEKLANAEEIFFREVFYLTALMRYFDLCIFKYYVQKQVCGFEDSVAAIEELYSSDLQKIESQQKVVFIMNNNLLLK